MKKVKFWFMNTPWAPFVVGPVVLLSIIVSAILFTPKILFVIPLGAILVLSGFLLYIIRDVIKTGLFK